ncbi:MAG: hypothetical protein JNL97_15655 [Verrucomicrobiales bacterium]|nr:hypothetical protein [Verrucomicrobiales bacterium]
MPGELEKLRIESYRQETRTGEPVETFTLQFNPAAFARAYEIEFNQQSGTGNTPGPAEFKSYKAQDYNLEFTLDGTGVSGGEPLQVAESVATFLRVTHDLDGETHRPRHLKLVWGQHLALRCILKSATVNYSLFKPDGSPLRAKITAVFSESVDEQLRTAREDERSADLTRAWIVRGAETLPLIAYHHYGKAEYYLRIARFNGLDDFRSLTPGQILRLPPADRLPVEESNDA